MRLLYILAIAFAVLPGCATVPKHSGDFGAFLQQELVNRGARIATTPTLPPIDARWSFSRDEYGFVAFVYGEHFAELDKWLQQAFGKPKISEERNLKGQPQRVYDPKVIGVALLCVRESQGVRIICVKQPLR